MTQSSKMLTRTICYSFALVLTSCSAALAEQSGPMGVYRHADGAEYFSLSLMADLPAAHEGRSIAVVFDTSASQTGMYRDTALAALRGLLGSLGQEDRVQILAADLDTRAMGDRFSPAGSQETQAAVEKLETIAPLGSTDMHKALSTAANLLRDTGSDNRVVVYIGDGVSTANLLRGTALNQTVDALRSARVSVNSYAVGPKVDAELLAAIANQSGGNLYIAESMARADEAQGISLDRAKAENQRRGAGVGRTLADWTHARVVWPTATTVSESIESVYPTKLPPLRSDRDTVVVGRLAPGAESISIETSLPNKTIAWRRKVAEPSESQAFLAELVSRAAKDQGASLPTLGSAGLNEVARMLNRQVDALTGVAETAIATGDRQGAAKIAEAVLRREPGNLRAQSVKRVAGADQTAQPAAEEDLKMVRVAQAEPVPTPAAVPAPATEIIVEGPVIDGVFEGPMPESGFEIIVDSGDFPPAESVHDDQLLSAVEKQNRVMAKQLEKEVQVALSEARDIMSNSPEDAIQGLKLMLQSVENAPELLADVRASLVDRLEGVLRQAARSASIKDELDRQREESEAASRDRQLMLDRMAQDREREKQLMVTFNALMDEEQYAEAEEVTEIVADIDPHGVTPVAAKLWAQHKRYHEYNMAYRQLKADRWLDAVSSIELASIPFPDEPPIVYPDAEFWREITARREKYKSVSLSGESESEQRILGALASPLTIEGLDFTETPLEEVVEFLRAEYDIEIQLDTFALDELGVGSDEPVTVNLRNITLRSALRIMLKQLELTYMIADEVLLITTEEEAETRLIPRVYDVGDIVMDKTPIQSIGGGGGFGGGGGGGGFGGGGGGGGFGGGGGGGGLGGGGGGGAFNVGDDLIMTKDNARASQQKQPAAASQTRSQSTPVRKRSSKPTAIKVDESVPAAEFWAAYFEQGERDQASVRVTVRKLMKRGDHEQVIELVQAALRNGQPQSWMFEALGIASQLANKPPAEVERAIMSAADFSNTPEELMLIAHYLVKLDLDLRAIQVLQQVVKIAPQRYDAYLLGLAAAERAEDADGLRWATIGILNRAWPTGQQAIESKARRLAVATLRGLEEQGQTSEYEAFRKELTSASVRDCVIRVTWTGDADVDLMVHEPDGSVCSLNQPHSPGGGVMLGDTFSSDKGPGLSGFSETYVCPKGFSGDYQARIHRVWGDVTAGVVTVDVYTNYGGPDQQHQSGQVVLGKGDSAVRFTLADGRRTEPLGEQQLAHAINRQQAIGRAVLAQQLSSISDPRVNTLRPDERERARRRQLAGARGGGAVGFQPVIVVLPDGTQFSVNAVASADRRYVIVRPSPSFTSISDVSTFTFAGASRDANDDNNDDDDDEVGVRALIGRRGIGGADADDGG